MGGRIKVLTVIGTRPEAIKLFPVIHALEADPRFESRVCVTGQHREMVAQVLQLAGIAPDHDLALMREGASLDTLAAAALLALGPVYGAEDPDWVVVQGDTTSAMIAALAAHHAQIQVCHVEAGLRSGNLGHPWPEEANRRIIAALSQCHCAPTDRAAAALLAENVAPAAVHITGNTGVDALLWMRDKLASHPELAPEAARLQSRFADRTLIVVTLHRREVIGPPLVRIAEMLANLARRDGLALVVPMHPNPAVREVLVGALGGFENVALVEPLAYGDFIRLLERCDLVLTDSGGVQEDAPVLGTPALVLRVTTERPEGLASGNVRLVGIDPDVIASQVLEMLEDDRTLASMRQSSFPYGDGKATGRVTERLACPRPGFA